MPDTRWPADPDGLVALQEELGRRAEVVRRTDPFHVPDTFPLPEARLSGGCFVAAFRPPAPLIGGCFVAFARGEAGPGRPGDRAFAAAVVWEPGRDALLRRRGGAPPARSEEKALRGRRRLAAAQGFHLADAPGPVEVVHGPRQALDVVEQVVVRQAVGAAYLPGLLALREGPVLAAAVAALGRRPDVLLVDASGADHPRRAGLAVHLGWALDLPTVGITRRPLRATGPPAERVRGRWSPLTLDGEVVAASVCTRTGTVPVVAHAGWSTDVDTAAAVALAASTEGARAPVPLQEARRVAREARDLAGA